MLRGTLLERPRPSHMLQIKASEGSDAIGVLVTPRCRFIAGLPAEVGRLLPGLVEGAEAVATDTAVTLGPRRGEGAQLAGPVPVEVDVVIGAA